MLLPRLDSLKMRYEPYHSENWLDFFKKHTQLSHLHFIEHHSKTTEHLPLNVFTADLSNLTDIEVEFNKYHGVHQIIDFIENHEKLQKFRFRFEFRRRIFPVEHVTILLERFGNELLKASNPSGLPFC